MPRPVVVTTQAAAGTNLPDGMSQNRRQEMVGWLLSKTLLTRTNLYNKAYACYITHLASTRCVM